MTRFRRTALCLGLVLAVGCRIEDHTPTGSRRDEEAVQALVSRYARTLSERDWNGARALFWPDAIYSGPMLSTGGAARQAVPIDLAINTIARRVQGLDLGRFDVRVLRSDYRQDGDLAAVWLTTRRLLPVAGSVVDGEWIEHLVLRRTDGEWRILSLAATASPRSGARGAR
ncbi:MAG TPA: nuclear transport factor 2 family protein [Gemmatimonadales bacterium]|nr:nuclear transport factor 2 family protein [Gemmatimonadales bacterium]